MSSPSLTGFSPNNPTKYLGPNVALTISVVRNREPTGADIKQPNTGKYYSFGTLWLVGETSPSVAPVSGDRGDIWYLAYIANNVAEWRPLSTGGGLSGLSINTQTFIASGVYVPTAGMVCCVVECWGGGGGGGGTSNCGATEISVAGGGAGGNYSRSSFTAAQIGVSQIVTIGQGGDPGTAGGGAGGDGSQTQFGALQFANPGGGGSGATASTGASQSGGGARYPVLSGGDFNIWGADGGYAWSSTIAELSKAGDGGSAPLGVTNPAVVTSGTMIQSFGGKPGDATTGMGGTGATSAYNGAGAVGGVGGSGSIVVTEYISV